MKFPEAARVGASPGKIWLVVSSTALVGVLHFAAPAGPGAWHWAHIVLQKLFYVPILMAAAWTGVPGTVAAALAASALFLVHVLRDWRGDAMVQAGQVGEIVSFWVIAAGSAFLFNREKSALEETAEAREETLEALACSLDLREHETALHSRRVRDYTLLLTAGLGIEGDAQLLNLGIGALLHDVGKIGIADSVLFKQGELTEDERKEIRRHPGLGATLIGQIRSLDDARELVLAHHEKFDGSGYPHGVAGREIPIGARIFAVADVFDALTAERYYRTPLSYKEVVEVMTAERGAHFDPDVVDAFLRVPFREWRDAALRNGVTLKES